MLELKDVSISVGSRTLIKNGSVTIFPGDKVGIVGHNGCGKTTLLRVITGELEVNAGGIYIKKGTKVVYVKQEIDNKNVSLLDFVLSADHTLINLRKKLSEHDQNLAEIYEQLDTIDGNSADARAAMILSGLGFKNEDLNKTLATFSGGWQVRAALAAALFAPSDILILDEPTNHLDLESVIWLESFLCASKKAMLIVSHERVFLDKICNKILNIDSSHLTLYSGNYSTFVRSKHEKQQSLLRQYESQQKKRDHIQEFIDRFRYKSTKARQVQSRLKVLEKMETIEHDFANYDVQFSLKNPIVDVDRKLISLEKVSAGYNNKIILHDVSLSIDYGERIAFLGANGNGKSTLAKIIAGKLLPFSGDIKRARNLKIAYFSQQQTDELDVNLTALELFQTHNPEQSETTVRSILASFGLNDMRSKTRIEQLSGGEKTRLLLAILSFQCPHVLILDEPTNHLDIEAREALVLSLKKYSGAVICISHDFYMLESSCNKFYIIDDNTCKIFSGGLEDYKSFLLSRNKFQTKEKEKKLPVLQKPDRKILRRITALEAEIESLSHQKSELEYEINSNYSIPVYEQYLKVVNDLKIREEAWLNLMESAEILN